MRQILDWIALFLLVVVVFGGILWTGTRDLPPEPAGTAEPERVFVPVPVFLSKKCPENTQTLPPAGVCWPDPAGEGEICTYWLGK